MSRPVRVAAVSYLNAKPLLAGLQALPAGEVELRLEVPARLPGLLAAGEADVALLPVAALPRIPGAYAVGTHGIAADGPVASVALFSQVPMTQIEEVLLDHQSCTSVALVQLLLAGHWRRQVRFSAAQEGYIDRIAGTRAGVIIGDRAMTQGARFCHKWDLAQVWKEWTGLPFVFAAWAAVRPLPEGFVQRFDEANAAGLERLDEIADAHAAQAGYDLRTYYRDHLRFRLDGRMRQGQALFLERLASLPPVQP
ncbi:menaquinone biosynthetic enzyme MqnA/MqnD family protein [Ramlibacter tataouinensis]|uniref:Chorismate dehydratase n=1 Tax=Ramlibacter tataouinensis (strain ATCC BAA-407 / DSM 14655 / LMG 21543 / TTB310) TaxID=365046 RepID=F5Y4C4_RAMTT|nr:menaquinone biosynthesis protein [Ramlibacter tataouinensis]AEG93771.1 Conserved hypothetical protein [Ramlibacter tataouinensis TTB310]